MPEFNFSLRFKLGDECEDPSQYLASLVTHGCTDAVVGVGSTGHIALDFSREAPTLMDAVASAANDASRAMPGARLIEVTCASEILASIHETMSGLHKIGLVDSQTMRKFDRMCRKPVA